MMRKKRSKAFVDFGRYTVIDFNQDTLDLPCPFRCLLNQENFHLFLMVFKLDSLHVGRKS